jgi:hypothetical protein
LQPRKEFDGSRHSFATQILDTIPALWDNRQRTILEHGWQLVTGYLQSAQTLANNHAGQRASPALAKGDGERPQAVTSKWRGQSRCHFGSFQLPIWHFKVPVQRVGNMKKNQLSTFSSCHNPPVGATPHRDLAAWKYQQQPRPISPLLADAPHLF